MIDYHRELLADETRTRAYRDAIRATVQPGDVVLDLGCGSGILSFFALEAGAARVYAIDRGHMADVAQFLSRHLGVAGQMTVLHETSTGVELPERADVLVTETMGVLIFDENMLSFVLDARRRLLRENAAMVPQRVALAIVPAEVPVAYGKRVGFWSEPRYGLDLTPLRVFASNSIAFIHLDPSSYVAAPQIVVDVDLRTFDSALVNGRCAFTAGRDGLVHGFGVWFETTLAEGIGFSTREPKSTHWAQALLPLETPLRVERGAAIEVDLETDDGRIWRWRGHAAGTLFDQTTIFAAPPCVRRD
ncbi:MAG TPA: 50S ribosomal protein L11 methyltransferase [Thermoanaerobaculia bacterium]|nr:50S ribosomal protein L11 methyltransferase [Thermoanaerobaculia bacterium]